MNIKNTGLAITILCQMWGIGAMAGEDGNWQLKMIHSPSRAQLKVEDRGRVYIYDRLHEADVESAMNTQFDRLENMMFVRTKVEVADDSTDYSDDGCD
jgi:hypothetical protein